MENSLVLWLDSSNIDTQNNTTLTSTSTSISEWLDLSGNGNNAIQTTSTSQPVFNSTNTGIDFDGSNDFLPIISSDLNFEDNNQGLTQIIVMEPTSTDDSYNGFLGYQESDSKRRPSLWFRR